MEDRPVYLRIRDYIYKEEECKNEESSERAFKIESIPDIDDIINSSSEPMVSIFIPETKLKGIL